MVRSKELDTKTPVSFYLASPQYESEATYLSIYSLFQRLVSKARANACHDKYQALE